uniref:Uncharacterized protein n=1 Tax=Panagrolaimus davidi TaxID=227884 RepID=A0A914PZV0_9BILA
MVSLAIFVFVFACLIFPSTTAYYYPSYTAYFQQDPRAAAYAQQQGFNIGYGNLQQQQLLQQQLMQQQLMAQRYGNGGYGGYNMDPYMQQQLIQQQYQHQMNPYMQMQMHGYGRPYSPFQQYYYTTALASAKKA